MADRLPALAAELARSGVDIIVTTTPPAAQAARQATTTIPIILGGVDDAVEQGFVASLARPGGNITGVSWLNTELSGKRLELLKEAFPKISRIAVLREAVGGAASLRATQAAARALGVRLHIMEVREPGEFSSAFSAMTQERVGAVIVLQGPMVASQEKQIVDLAAKSRLPAIFSDGHFVEVGGLMSYGPRLSEFYRRAATYVDKILRGARPDGVPVEQPSQFELRVNLKTARALRVTIPSSILLRADDVIQ
jgi:putative ABC transport system substrate-binding protein